MAMTDPPTPVEQRLIAHGLRLDELEDAVKTLASTDPAKIPRPNWKHQTLDEWVRDWYAVHYARSSGIRWCAQWYEHPEAVARLHALWTAWEAAQRNPDTGMAHWYVHYADPMFHELVQQRGTFVSCDPDGHSTPKPLKCDPDPSTANTGP
jgi:hypothetical protein